MSVSLFLLKSLDFSFCSILTLAVLTTSAIVFTAFKVSEFKGYPLTCRVRLHLGEDSIWFHLFLVSLFCSFAQSHFYFDKLNEVSCLGRVCVFGLCLGCDYKDFKKYFKE